MAILDIKYYPDPILRHKCESVTHIDSDITTLLDDMLETMYHAQGIGLAAPQIGDKRRVIVMDVKRSDDEPPQPFQMINPEITEYGDDIKEYNEGCLSVPDFYEMIKRPIDVKAKYLDKEGNEKFLEAHGLLAICLQHEIDHLNGIVFFDHLSKLKRDMLIKKYNKANIKND